ncbi:MAG: hypothetical protein ABIH23_27840, partial [bacterium]
MSEPTKERMLDLIRPVNFWRLNDGDLDVVDAIRRLIESSGLPVKCPVCDGGGMVPIEPPPGTANPTSQTCHSCFGRGWIIPFIESSGERPCATVPKLSITHGDDGYWLCIDSPSGKHAGIHIEKRPEMTIVNAVLAEVAIELAGGEQPEPEKPAPLGEQIDALRARGLGVYAGKRLSDETLALAIKPASDESLMHLAQRLGVPFSAAKIIHDRATAEKPAPTSEERDRLDKFLITMMSHVKEVYEANGTPWREDDEERFTAIRTILLEQVRPAPNDEGRRRIKKPTDVVTAQQMTALIDDMCSWCLADESFTTEPCKGCAEVKQAIRALILAQPTPGEEEQPAFATQPNIKLRPDPRPKMPKRLLDGVDEQAEPEKPTPPDESLMHLAQRLGVPFSAAKIIHDR